MLQIWDISLCTIYLAWGQLLRYLFQENRGLWEEIVLYFLWHPFQKNNFEEFPLNFDSYRLGTLLPPFFAKNLDWWYQTTKWWMHKGPFLRTVVPLQKLVTWQLAFGAATLFSWSNLWLYVFANKVIFARCKFAIIFVLRCQVSRMNYWRYKRKRAKKELSFSLQ